MLITVFYTYLAIKYFINFCQNYKLFLILTLAKFNKL